MSFVGFCMLQNKTQLRCRVFLPFMAHIALNPAETEPKEMLKRRKNQTLYYSTRQGEILMLARSRIFFFASCFCNAETTSLTLTYFTYFFFFFANFLSERNSFYQKVL